MINLWVSLVKIPMPLLHENVLTLINLQYLSYKQFYRTLNTLPLDLHSSPMNIYWGGKNVMIPTLYIYIKLCDYHVHGLSVVRDEQVYTPDMPEKQLNVKLYVLVLNVISKL